MRRNRHRSVEDTLGLNCLLLRNVKRAHEPFQLISPDGQESQNKLLELFSDPGKMLPKPRVPGYVGLSDGDKSPMRSSRTDQYR